METDAESLNWYALRTRYQHESVVESHLGRKHIEVYLPKVSKVRQWKDRRKEMEFPMFPGYVFVKPRASQFLELTFIPGSCGLVMVRNRPGVVHPREMDAMRRLIGTRMPVEMHPELLPGSRIKVLAGPLEGLEGELVRYRNRDRLVINSYILKQSVSVEVDVGDVMQVQASEPLAAAFHH